jgi:hypothetical protein
MCGDAHRRLAVALSAALGLLLACRGAEAPPPTPAPGLDARQPDPGPRRTGELSEADRRSIYLEVLRAEANANAEGLRLFPDLDPMAKSFDDDRYQKVMKKRRSTQEALALKYRAQIAERNGLTREQLEALMQEGRQANWPTPPPSTPPSPAAP